MNVYLKQIPAYCSGSGKRATRFGTDTCPSCGKTYTVTNGLEIRKHVSPEGRARAAAAAAAAAANPASMLAADVSGVNASKTR